MSVFAVVALRGYATEGLEKAVSDSYAGKFVRVSEGHWLVLDKGATAQIVSEKLGLIGAGSPNVAIVYNVAGYFGKAPSPVWEWLAANFGARS